MSLPNRQSATFCLLLIAISCSLPAAEPTPPEGFRVIFNGKDLTGWYGRNPHSVDKLSGEKRDAALKQMRDDFPTHWRVVNGELVNDGHGPYATTDAELGDIELGVTGIPEEVGGDRKCLLGEIRGL